MSQNRRLTSKAVIIAVAATVFWPGPVLADDAAEVESLRREVRQLQAQMHVLRTAVAEATELERQRSAKLVKQLGEPRAATEPEPSPPAPVAMTEPATGSRETSAAAAPAGGEERTSRTKHRRHRHSSRSRKAR